METALQSSKSGLFVLFCPVLKRWSSILLLLLKAQHTLSLNCSIKHFSLLRYIKEELLELVFDFKALIV